MKVTVLYFAQLKQQAGVAEESVDTKAADATQLYQEIKHTRSLSMDLEHLRVARNGAFCSSDEKISDGDVVAFMPPMAGG